MLADWSNNLDAHGNTTPLLSTDKYISEQIRILSFVKMYIHVYRVVQKTGTTFSGT